MHNVSVYVRTYCCMHLCLHVCMYAVPVAALSKAWVYGRSPAAILGSNPTEDMDVCRVCCVLSGRGLCDDVITCPEESYRLWRVGVCDHETS
jgi:hypothetical protein